MATQDGKLKLIVDLPEDLKLNFKSHCAQNKLPMCVVIEKLVRGYLLEQKQFHKEKGAV